METSHGHEMHTEHRCHEWTPMQPMAACGLRLGKATEVSITRITKGTKSCLRRTILVQGPARRSGFRLPAAALAIRSLRRGQIQSTCRAVVRLQKGRAGRWTLAVARVVLVVVEKAVLVLNSAMQAVALVA